MGAETMFVLGLRVCARAYRLQSVYTSLYVTS